LNVDNMLNKRWGRIDEIAFSGSGGQQRGFVNVVGRDAQGRYIYSVKDRADDFVTRGLLGGERRESFWALQATFKYEF